MRPLCSAALKAHGPLCTLFAREQAGIVIFPLSENEEPRLDAHSLRGMEI